MVAVRRQQLAPAAYSIVVALKTRSAKELFDWDADRVVRVDDGPFANYLAIHAGAPTRNLGAVLELYLPPSCGPTNGALAERVEITY